MESSFNPGDSDPDEYVRDLLQGKSPSTQVALARAIADSGKEQMDSMRDILDWLSEDRSFRLEKNECSRLHHLKEAAANDRVLGIDGTIQEARMLASDEVQHTFVVKHDWGRAFSGADGLDDSIRLPYQICSFEFRIDGRNVISVAGDSGSDLLFTSFVQSGDYWCCLGSNKHHQDSVIQVMWDQIRAICIALDAEVASHTVQRAPHKLNKKRIAAGKLPISDFHVVDLARKNRITNPTDAAERDKPRKRLHFRRGHWRHFDVSKTWIRWCLVGDPDLGFIRKHYTI